MMRCASTCRVMLVLVAAGAPVVRAQSPPTFSVAVETVYADVSVSRDGQPVSGLTAEVFELNDNGVRQRVELVDAEALPLLAVLVFDTSRSTAGAKLLALQAAGDAFLDSLRPTDRVSLVTFSEEIAWPALPTADKTPVRAALAKLRAGGATSVLDALYTAITLSDSGPRALVALFTDGADNMSWLDEEQLRVFAPRSNALVHVVGWRAGIDATVAVVRPDGTTEPAQVRGLRGIAEATGGRFWEADSPARLRAAFTAIADSMGHRYLLRYEPTGVKRDGWHRIEVRLRGTKANVQARPGYWVARGR
jgi:VWFA-related protein